MSEPEAVSVDVNDVVSLRERVLAHLRNQGFQLANDRLIRQVDATKDELRALHESSVRALRERARPALQRYEPAMLARLAHPGSVEIDAITPKLVPIGDYRSADARLWRWASLHWSIPISAGYGRRLRFLVVDAAHHDKLIGLIGLSDPVFSLGARDRWLGWDSEARKLRLTNVMDAYALGAVPPYSRLRAGKLVALLATSTEVRDAFAARYGHRNTLISERDPDAQLAMVTTTSALGRSSIYNRLSGPHARRAWFQVGYTSGSGDFHLSGPVYDELADLARSLTTSHNRHTHARWRPQDTARNRREVIQRALKHLDLPARQLRFHGVQRQIFLAPLVRNIRDHLVEGAQPAWVCSTAEANAAHWLDRWARPAAGRDQQWDDFDPSAWTLWSTNI